MANTVNEQTVQSGVFIPTNLKAGRFTQFAFDNLDLQEYTKDGRTLNGTKHIIFQYKDPDEELKTVASVPLLKKRQSSPESFQPFQITESHLSFLESSHPFQTT